MACILFEEERKARKEKIIKLKKRVQELKEITIRKIETKPYDKEPELLISTLELVHIKKEWGKTRIDETGKTLFCCIAIYIHMNPSINVLQFILSLEHQFFHLASFKSI